MSNQYFQVLVEIVDLPKSYNTVYGIGPGTRLDAEISVYMKAMNWPDRVQVSDKDEFIRSHFLLHILSHIHSHFTSLAF